MTELLIFVIFESGMINEYEAVSLRHNYKQ
jgi:hypothetical protein